MARIFLCHASEDKALSTTEPPRKAYNAINRCGAFGGPCVGEVSKGAYD